MKKLTNEQFLEKLYSIRNNAHPQEEYKGSNIKILVNFGGCEHEPQKITPSNLFAGQGCSKCKGDKIKNILIHSHNDFLDWIFENRPLTVFPLEKYKGIRVPIKFLWYKCGCITSTIPIGIKKGTRCGKCAGRYYTHNDFLDWIFENRAEELFPLEKYKVIDIKIKVLWNICYHITEISPYKIKTGRGCGVCAGQHYTYLDYLDWIFENRPLEVFPLERYINTSTPIKHLWVECGCVYKVCPASIKAGRGCGVCDKKHYNHEDYVRDISHLDYVEVDEDYIKGNIPIFHIFKPCGHRRKVAPRDIKLGNGCGKCSNRISNKEINWINGIEKNLDRKLIKQYTFNPDNKLYKSDAYDKETNTLYEFYGDYWHGNPEIFNSEFCHKKYRKTLEREELIKSLGYNLIIIWENDFNKIKNF